MLSCVTLPFLLSAILSAFQNFCKIASSCVDCFGSLLGVVLSIFATQKVSHTSSVSIIWEAIGHSAVQAPPTKLESVFEQDHHVIQKQFEVSEALAYIPTDYLLTEHAAVNIPSLYLFVDRIFFFFFNYGFVEFSVLPMYHIKNPIETVQRDQTKIRWGLWSC